MIALDEPWPSMTKAAFGFASSRHTGQYREIDGAPFIAHPLEVGRLLHRNGQPDHVAAAGLLHDVLEKTNTTPQELGREFGKRVARLVEAVSDDPSITDYDERKRELRDRVARSDSDTLAMYAADKIAKLRELGLLSPWRASQRTNQAKLAHYRAGLEMLRRVAGQSDLVLRLEAELNRPLLAAWHDSATHMTHAVQSRRDSLGPSDKCWGRASVLSFGAWSGRTATGVLPSMRALALGLSRSLQPTLLRA